MDEAQEQTKEQKQAESELVRKPHPHSGLWSMGICMEALLDPAARQEL